MYLYMKRGTRQSLLHYISLVSEDACCFTNSTALHRQLSVCRSTLQHMPRISRQIYNQVVSTSASLMQETWITAS